MLLFCATCGERRDDEGPCPRCGGRLERSDLLAANRRRGPIGEYLAGVGLALRSIRLTLTRPRLLTLVAIPLLINVGLIVFLTIWLSRNADAWLPALDSPWIRGFDWARVSLAAVLDAAAGLVAFIVAVILMLMGSTIVNAPFYEWISEAVENLVVGRPDPRPMGAKRIFRTVIWPVFQAIQLAILQGVIGLTLLLLSLSGVLAPLAVVGGVWLLAVGLADVVIARKGARVAGRFENVNRSLPAWLGLATPLWFVPFLLPLFVAGATLVYLRDLALRRAA
jgi:uncharacterized protein involved in cysteine biosynthesis